MHCVYRSTCRRFSSSLRRWLWFSVLHLVAGALSLIANHASALADVIDDRVHSIVRGEDQEPDLVYLAGSGRVLVVENKGELDQFLPALERSQRKQSILRIEFEPHADFDVIQSVSDLAETLDEASLNTDKGWPQESTEAQELSPEIRWLSKEGDFGPLFTRLIAPSAQQVLFQYLRSKKLRKEAQCYQRAYVWAYELEAEKGLRARKIFSFFTTSFIRKHRFRWWFHVAPVIDVSGVPYVLDATYTEGPRTVEGWLKDIMKVDAECPVVDRFKGKGLQHRDLSCYVRFTNRFVYGTNHLERLDGMGVAPTRWESWALKEARQATRP